MRTRKLRKPAAVVASLALALAIGACDSADPDTSTTLGGGDGATTTFVDDLATTTIVEDVTSTTAAG